MSIVANIKNILIAFAILVFVGGGMFFWGTQSCTVVPETVTITIPSTGVITTDTIYLDKIVEVPVPIDNVEYVVDSAYYHKYLNEVEENKKLLIFLDAITVRDTTLTLVDNDTIKINVFSKMRGELIAQAAEYTIKEKEVIAIVDMVVPKYNLYIGGAVTVPLNDSNYKPTVGAGLLLRRTKQDDMFKVMVHTNRSISFSYMLRIFKK